MAEQELINLTIDGKPVAVPKGTNLIEAAKTVGIEIPHYCYHPKLSIAGNCRMCQVRVKNSPKMEIACNTAVREGMEVATHLTSKEVADTQAAVLEFILINHPMDCTVCDQAGHCKLQDYHYEYSAKFSRFEDEKEHKVKAEPLGPTVMLDGERCIMCTRCIRFCDEVTKTSELGMLNRGDRSVIAVAPGHELNNPLSGTVVDLCPVGALTHRHWRFNTRIWFTQQTDTICPGCSTGCSCKVATRDNQVVLVKARYNPAVNQEWLCDEGRYGFERFLPENRQVAAQISGAQSAPQVALLAAREIFNEPALVFVAGDLLLEEYLLLKQLLDASGKPHRLALNYRERKLSDTEQILISPDYAANFSGALFSGLVAGDLEGGYVSALAELRSGNVERVLFCGERAVCEMDLDEALLNGVRSARQSVALGSDASSLLLKAAKIVLPGQSILEKSGLLINRAKRLQYSSAVVSAPAGSLPEWVWLSGMLSGKLEPQQALIGGRDLTIRTLNTDQRLRGLAISAIKAGGIPLQF